MRVEFGSAPENVDKLGQVVLEETAKLRMNGPSADEVKKIQEMERRDLETSLRQNAYWLNSLQTVHLLGWDPRRIAARLLRPPPQRPPAETPAEEVVRAFLVDDAAAVLIAASAITITLIAGGFDVSLAAIFILAIQDMAKNEASARTNFILLRKEYGDTPYGAKADNFLFELDHLQVGMVAPDVEAMVVTPICAHSLGSRALVLPESAEIDVKVKGHDWQTRIRTEGTTSLSVSENRVAPGGHFGWHSHPGPAVALIKAGELTLYSGDDSTCTGRTYSAGQAFVDSGQGHVHMARNLSQTDNLEVWVTYFDVPPGGAFRLDRPDPGNCGF